MKYKECEACLCNKCADEYCKTESCSERCRNNNPFPVEEEGCQNYEQQEGE